MVIESLDTVADKLARFVQTCHSSENEYRLSQNSETSAFALCFGIFSGVLLRDQRLLDDAHDLANSLRKKIREERSRWTGCPTHKPYRQLLAFVLTALSALGLLREDPLDDLVVEQINCDIAKELHA